MKAQAKRPGPEGGRTAADDGRGQARPTVPQRPAQKRAPEWIELIPAGEFVGRDGRGPFRLSNPPSVIAATRALRMGGGLPIDYDHATDFAAPRGRRAPAAGWIRKLMVRDGAIWGRVEWTPHGAAAVITGEYRYISPVFEYAKDGEVKRLLRAGLTNNPNLYLTAISSRVCARVGRGGRLWHVGDGLALETHDVTIPGGGDDHRAEDEEMDEFLAKLREILGLEEAATPEMIVEMVRRMAERATPAKNQGTDEAADGDDEEPDEGTDEAADDAAMSAGAPDPSRYVGIAQFKKALSELNALRAERMRERAEHAVDEAVRAGKLVPAQREWALAYCQADFDGFAAFTARQPAAFGRGAPRLGRIEAEEAGGRAASLSRNEIAVCAQLGISHENYLRRKHGAGDFLRLNNRD